MSHQQNADYVLPVGTKVSNQDPSHPLTGEVIPTPPDQGEPDGWVWVAWSNHLVCSEYPADLAIVST